MVNILDATNREIIGWGKSDYEQTQFPIEYMVDWISESDDYNGYPPGYGSANSAPLISLGGDHTLVTGSHVYRAPSMTFNYPYQFNGTFGDTLYQTLTFQNIGPDLVHIDNIFFDMDGDSLPDTLDSHPFYMIPPEDSSIVFGDSISFDIYTIYDSLHPNDAFINLIAHSTGWHTDTTVIPLSSLFAPSIEVLEVPDYYLGNLGETIYQNVKFVNDGNIVAYIDSISLPENMTYEPLGEEDSILPGDSIEIYLGWTFPLLPLEISGQEARFFFKNFNYTIIGIPVAGRRYLRAGDNIALTPYSNSYLYYCGQQFSSLAASNSFRLSALSEQSSNSRVRYFELAYFDSLTSNNYQMLVDSLRSIYFDIPTFHTFLGFDYVSTGWPELCLECLYDLDNSYNALIFNSSGNFNSLFNDNVQSIVVDDNAIIRYIGAFDYDSLTTYINESLDDCGVECISNSSIQLSNETIEVNLSNNDAILDTIIIYNDSDYFIEYESNIKSGKELINSIHFQMDHGAHHVIIPAGVSPPFTISFWIKGSAWVSNNWGNANNYISFISSYDSSGVAGDWEIIFDSPQPFENLARIGWKDSENYFLSNGYMDDNDPYHHCVFIHDGNSVQLYMNGEQEFNHPVTSQLTANSHLRINNINEGFFEGNLSQTAVWFESLEEEKIQEIYNQGVSGNIQNMGEDYTVNMSSYLTMDNMSGSIITDHSGNDLHGVISGISNFWNIDIDQIDIEWANIVLGQYQQIPPNGSANNIVSINSSNLDPGTYHAILEFTSSSQLFGIQNIAVIELNVDQQMSLEDIDNIPLSYDLKQNFPNPFNPITKITYTIPTDEFVDIKVYDINGREVRSLINTEKLAGRHLAVWDGKNNLGNNTGAGVYMLKMYSKSFSKTVKMLLLK